MSDLTGITELRALPSFGEELAASVGKPDWIYYDLPQMSPEYWVKLTDEIIGPSNLCFLTMAHTTNSSGEWLRGQILISPQGMDNIREYKRMHTL